MSTRTLAPTLGAIWFPNRTRLVWLASVLAGTGLVALAAQISIPLPFTPVPLTGQTFAVLLVGSALGPVGGFASLTLYLYAGIAGAPIYAGGEGGLDVLKSPSGGYIVGFVVAATVCGRLAEAGWDRKPSSAVGAMLTGSVLIYLIGLPWLAWQLGTGLDETLELGLYPFIPGDMIKLYLAALCLPACWRLLDRAHRP